MIATSKSSILETDLNKGILWVPYSEPIEKVPSMTVLSIHQENIVLNLFTPEMHKSE